MYDYTRIASYRHLRAGNVGGEYGYWLLRGTNADAGGFPSNPILSGSAPNTVSVVDKLIMYRVSANISFGSGSEDL